MATAILFLVAFVRGLFSRQAFSSKAAPQSAAQIKDHTAMYKNLTRLCHITYENTQKVSCLDLTLDKTVNNNDCKLED